MLCMMICQACGLDKKIRQAELVEFFKQKHHMLYEEISAKVLTLYRKKGIILTESTDDGCPHQS